MSRIWVTGGIEKHVCDSHHCFLMRSQSYKNKNTHTHTHKKKKKKKKSRRKFSSFKDDRELLGVIRVIGGIEKVFVDFIFFAIALIAIFKQKQ